MDGRPGEYSKIRRRHHNTPKQKSFIQKFHFKRKLRKRGGAGERERKGRRQRESGGEREERGRLFALLRDRALGKTTWNLSQEVPSHFLSAPLLVNNR